LFETGKHGFWFTPCWSFRQRILSLGAGRIDASRHLEQTAFICENESENRREVVGRQYARLCGCRFEFFGQGSWLGRGSEVEELDGRGFRNRGKKDGNIGGVKGNLRSLD
jgi:hypothetical protein